MNIDRIALRGVTATNGEMYCTWINSVKNESDRITISLMELSEGKSKRRNDYHIENFIYCLCNDSDFIITDENDGSYDATIAICEVKALVKSFFLSIPGSIGKFKLRLSFIPNDPRIPF